MNTWNKSALDELGAISRGRSRHRPRNSPHLYDGNYPFIQTGDIKAAGLYIRTYSQTYNEAGLEQSKLWQPGTLCITIAANIADTAILGMPACFPDSVIGFIPDETKVDVKFIKYYFDLFQKVFQQISQGAAQDNLSAEKLLRLKIPTPPLPIQKKIGTILSAYDDLIENNLKRIKLLEEMAQITYEEWFLHQRIGNKHISDDEFENCLLNTLISDYKNGGWGKEEPDTAYTSEAFVIRGTDIPDLRAGNYDTLPLRFHTPGNLSARKLLTGDICIEISNGNINNIGRSFYFDESLESQLGKDVICASFCKLLRPLNFHLSYLIDIHLKYIHQNNQMLVYKSQGANGINNFQFENMISEELLPVPNGKALDEIIASFHSIYKAVSTLRRQNHLLKEARDILLPRLMTGMIDVEQLVLPEPLNNLSPLAQEPQAA